MNRFVEFTIKMTINDRNGQTIIIKNIKTVVCIYYFSQRVYSLELYITIYVILRPSQRFRTNTHISNSLVYIKVKNGIATHAILQNHWTTTLLPLHQPWTKNASRWPNCRDHPGRSTWTLFGSCRWCRHIDPRSRTDHVGRTSVEWPYRNLARRWYFIKLKGKICVCKLPSFLNEPLPSITFPHHPDAHGTAVTPRILFVASSIWVTLNVNGSLHDPPSPLDRHW